MLNIIDSIRKKSVRIFSVVAFAFFMYLFIYTISKYNHYGTLPAYSIFIGVIGILFIGIVQKIFTVFDKISTNLFLSVLIIATIIFTGALLYVAKSMDITPLTDARRVYYSAAEYLTYGKISNTVNEYTGYLYLGEITNYEYMLMYPNNRFIFILVTVVLYIPYKIGVDLFAGGVWCAVVFNVICIGIVPIIISLTTYILTEKKSTALTALLRCIGFVPYYINGFHVYTDTLSLPITSLILLFSALLLKSQKGKKQISYTVILSIMCAAGFLIKGSIVIIYIAVLIYIFVKRENIADTLKTEVLLIIPFVLVLSVWNIYVSNCKWIDLSGEDRYKLPLSHWFMMSCVGNGGWTQEDQDFSLSFETYSERNDACLTEFKNRLNSYGNARNYLKFIRNKLTDTLSDGLYTQMNHLSDGKKSSKIIGYLFSMDHPFLRIIYVYNSAFTIIFYLSFIVSSLFNFIKRDNDYLLFVNITFFGILIFFSFWEFKSRYLLNFTPMFILCRVLTITKISDYILQNKIIQ